MPRSLTFKSSLLLLVTVFCLASWARTQISNTQPRAINLDFTMRPGETRLEGTIRKIDRVRQQFTLEVDILVTGDNSTGDIRGPGLHSISVDDTTSFGNRATGKLDLALDNLVVGSDAIIIGLSPSQAGPIRARLVAVSASKASQTPPALPPRRFLNPGRLAPPAPQLQPALRRQAPPALAAPAPPKPQLPQPQQPQTRLLPPAQSPLAAHAAVLHTAKRAGPRVAAAQLHAAVVAQLKSSTPQPLPRLGQGVATYAPAASPVARSTSQPVPLQVAPAPQTQNVAPRMAALPATEPRAWPVPFPPAVLTRPTTGPGDGYISPPHPAAPAPASNLAPEAPTQPLSSNNQGGARATNPLSATPNPTPNLSALTATARQRFQARQIAQNEIHYNYFSGGTPQEKLVALTFDDGPNPAGTPAVLDILKREGVPATFFLIGRNAQRHPELVLRELAEGHDIGNHTYHHRQRTNLSLQEWRDEIGQTNAVIVNIVGAPTRWFRAPGCHYTAATLQAIQELDMVRVDTTNNSSDWDKRSATVISESVLERLAPGNVLLFHDPMPETARALPHLIHEIRNRGYRFVLLGELALRAQATPGFQPAFRPLGQGIVISK